MASTILTSSGVRQLWFHHPAPSPDVLANLLQELDLPEDLFDELLEQDQSPRLERVGSYLLLVMQFPWRNEGVDAECVLRPLALLWGGDRLWTFSEVEWPFLREWNARKFQDPRVTLIWLLQLLAASYLRTVGRLRQEILVVEARLDATQRTEDFYALLALSKALTRFYVTLASNIVAIFKVSRSAAVGWDEANRAALNLAIADLQHARDRAEISANTASDMMDAYAGMVQININHGLKILTVLALVLYVPSLVATIFGVNVPLLEQNSHWTAWVAMGVAFGISLVMSVHFKRRGWL
ncbi:magnesium transporter CorA family protein [Candidatus Igneacidithiobacillus taiwanensis]|uniref:magnesium transporter CorA family protein n=1 Tax=Candidatus Igneacidithiobacillus taiwanensis TaxID=1945924 RepID=UPI00289E966B|nr:magnesium transporter CorA family protein [Candidatus Igneacidithiobacillus taiwanensis]